MQSTFVTSTTLVHQEVKAELFPLMGQLLTVTQMIFVSNYELYFVLCVEHMSKLA